MVTVTSAVLSSLAAYAALLAAARTSLGRQALGLTAREAADQPAGSVLAALVLAAAAAWAVFAHSRRYQVPVQSLWPRALAELASLAVTAAVVARVTHGSLPAGGAVFAAATVVGAFFTWFGVRWLRVPERLLPAPEPGQVWWALIPFEESNQAKDRPCLVLSVEGRRATVLMFTSQDKTGRAGYAPVPPGLWRQPRISFLRTDRRIRVRLEDFRRLETHADPGTLQAAGLTR